MEYKLRNINLSTKVENCLEELLIDRGVEDINAFLNPSKNCELNPYDLENISNAALMLLKHLRADSKILIIVD